MAGPRPQRPGSVEVGGDDDCEEDLDHLPADEPPADAVSDADYYADALGVLP